MRKLLEGVADWVGRYQEQIKLLFAVIAAVWILTEYWSKQHEARVERTVAYIKQMSEGRLLSAELAMTKYWTDPAIDERLRSVRGDQKKFDEIVIESVEKSLFTEVWRTYNFYKALSICVTEGLCDADTACRRFRRDLPIFLGNTSAYFEKYHKNFQDDAMKPIRGLLAHPACQSSPPPAVSWPCGVLRCRTSAVLPAGRAVTWRPSSSEV
jgi:hypothetical protein